MGAMNVRDAEDKVHSPTWTDSESLACRKRGYKDTHLVAW